MENRTEKFQNLKEKINFNHLLQIKKILVELQQEKIHYSIKFGTNST